MARGPAPTPTALRIVKGNPSGRPLPKNEPRPEVAKRVPPPPKTLSPEAKRHWKAVAKMLYDAKVLTRLDEPALEMLCDAYARWVEATDKVRQHGMVVKTPNDYPVMSPFLSIANREFDKLAKMLQEFGMTPSSRTRVSATAKGETTDPFEDFLRGKGSP